MNTANFEKIIISFSRPADAATGYEFLKEPAELPSGGLHKQIVMAVDKVSLFDLVEKFATASGFASQFVGTTAGLVVAAVITASLDLVSIKSFPDECSPILGLLKTTPHGSALDWEAINNVLANSTVPAHEIFEALVKENFLHVMGSDYIVIKKVLMQTQVDFI
jgi:hypothetical protein